MAQIWEPCPFCRSSNTLGVTTIQGSGEPYPYPDRTFVACGDCKASGPVIETLHVRDGDSVGMSVKLAAVARWNLRA
jgi:hypothetical protein